MALTALFESVLIANRGEIAVRVARTCRAMGIRTIAVYSDADARAPHVRACDQAVRIGPAPARESYLNVAAVIEAAKQTRAQAVHPGYGFLSENPAFAEACESAGVAFVGPPAAAMRAMGDKVAAKRTAEAVGVPIVPGYLGPDQSIGMLTEHAKRIGLPLLVKAAAGGGGKGMRLVTEGTEFAEAVAGAKREASAAFGHDAVFLEKYLARPRHIEIQVLADARGNAIHLGERECSIQRRHQKVLEETPSPAVSAALRAEMGAAAVRAALAVGYVNAGTVEFMLDVESNYYFLEMNTRLQVEHPVTELVLGIDLVCAQLLIAAGHALPLRQEDVAARGHAIEVRIYAEDAEHGFLPSVGRITHVELPEGPGVRNDAGIEPGSDVTVDYDPMLAKLIVQDGTRSAAIGRLRCALDEYVVGGVTTNLAFLRWLVRHEAFGRGDTTTAFIDEHFTPDALRDPQADQAARLAAAAAWIALAPTGAVADPWRRLGAWRHSARVHVVSFAGKAKAALSVSFALDRNAWQVSDGRRQALVEQKGAGAFTLQAGGATSRFVAWPRPGGVALSLAGRTYAFEVAAPPSVEASAHGTGLDRALTAGVVQAPMTGTVVKVDVRKGDRVRAHQLVAVLEAMKMEHAVVAPYDGSVSAVRVKAGATVIAGATLVEIEPA